MPMPQWRQHSGVYRGAQFEQKVRSSPPACSSRPTISQNSLPIVFPHCPTWITTVGAMSWEHFRQTCGGESAFAASVNQRDLSFSFKIQGEDSRRKIDALRFACWVEGWVCEFRV
eukprot:1192404-Prorocentrum_minimum.AAC.4